MALTLVSVDPKANAKAEVVEMAKVILEQAEAGELIDLTFAASLLDGSVTTGFTPTEDQMRRIAAVARLQHRLHISMDETTHG